MRAKTKQPLIQRMAASCSHWLIRLVRWVRLECKIWAAENNARYFLERSKCECGCITDKRFYAEYEKYAKKATDLRISKYT